MNPPQRPLSTALNANHEFRSNLPQIIAILSASELHEIGRFFPSKNDPIAKFELSEETLLRLRNMRKLRSFDSEPAVC